MLDVQGIILNDPIHEFRNGVYLSIVIASLLDNVDVEEIYYNPLSKSEITHNLAYLINLMKRFGIPVCVTIQELGEVLDQDLILLQLSYIYKALRDRSPRVLNIKRLRFKDNIKISLEAIPIEISSLVNSDFIKPQGFFSQFTPRGGFLKTDKLDIDFTKGSDSTSAVSDISPSDISNHKYHMDRSLSPIKFESFSPISYSSGVTCDDPMISHEKIHRNHELKPRKTNILNIQTSPKFIPSPSLRLIRGPEPSLSQNEIKEKALLYLLTPRILKLNLSGNYQAYIFSLIINQQSPDDYSFEWRNLETMKIEVSVLISEIIRVNSNTRLLYLQTNAKTFEIQCLDHEEASRYAQAFLNIKVR